MESDKDLDFKTIEKIGTTMDFYMFKYYCPGWFGKIENVQHIVVPPKTSEKKVIDLAQKFSNTMTGSESCNINLLQKYLMTVYPEKSFPSITNLSFYEK